MSAKELLINLFQLPITEIIFQDYGCAFCKGVLKHGRLFIAENHICFYANILGIKTKVVIKVNDIVAIEKKKYLGVISNGIEIVCKDQKYSFTSFHDRDSVYQLLHALWTGQPVNFTPEEEEETDSKIERNSIEQNAEVEVNFLSQTEQNQEEQVELMKATFPITVDKFFDLLLSEEAVFSFADHRKNRGDFETTLSAWALQEEAVYMRELKTVIKLVDVPFKDRSRMHIVQTYKKENGILTFSAMTKTLDIPFANYFQLEQRWEITPIEGDANKCQLRCFAWIVFLKSTYMKKTILSRSMAGVKEDYEIWVNAVKKKLESLQSKPEVKTQQGHEYEESKNIENNAILERSQSVKKDRKTQQLDINKKHFSQSLGDSQFKQLTFLWILMVFLLIIIQVGIIILLKYLINQMDSRMTHLEELILQVQNPQIEKILSDL